MSTTITGSPIADDEVVIESQVAAHNSVSQGLTPNGYLMESYTSGNWTVTKWADGRMQMEYQNGFFSGFAINNFYFTDVYQGTVTFLTPEVSTIGWIATGSSVTYSTGASWSQPVANGFSDRVVIRAWDVAARDGSANSSVSFTLVGRWK